MEKTINITVSISKSGLGCVWERGGGYTSTGNSIIITDRNGNPKKAIYLPKCYACGQHALVPITVNDYVIQTSRYHDDYNIEIYRVIDMVTADAIATLSLVNKYDSGVWDSPLSENLNNAVEAAKRKARCYHCREPHYIKEE